MIVITDSNVFISALISPRGSVASIFKSKSKIQFFAPDFIFIEINNHLDKIRKSSHLSRKVFDIEYAFLKTRVKLIKVSTIPRKYLEESEEIVSGIDRDDFVFVALGRYKKCRIWTGDKVLINGLLKKGYDMCITTSELKNKLYKKRE